jgi:hypothetical protein
MKKIVQTLLLICSSLLLLISITVSASAQRGESGRDRYGRRFDYIVSGTIRWKKDKGVAPMGPGNSQPVVYPCSIFTVAALNSNTNKPVAYTDQGNSPFQRADEGDYYVCRYSLKVPENTGLYILATMGGILGLPEEDRNSMFITDAWIGGSRSKPPAGAERSFTGHQYVTLAGRRSRAIVNFEMVYAPSGPH